MKKIILLVALVASFANVAKVKANRMPLGDKLMVAPAITSFSPSSGSVGTLVSISGSNLDNTTSFSIGGAQAIVVSNTGSTLVGMVMPGAATGGISVSTSGGTATAIGNFTVTPTPYPGSQQGAKLVGTGAIGASEQGFSIAVSADGNTAIMGGYRDNSNTGAAWVYTRSGGTWSQQGSKLVGTGATGAAQQGKSVAISADGNTAIIGGSNDNSAVGAAWVYTRSGGTWAQQGSKLVGTGATGASNQGLSISLSADGNTAMVGGNNDNSNTGAAWVYIRSGGTWTQQGAKLVGTGATGAAQQGISVSLSADGNTAVVGGSTDNSNAGAFWVYSRSGSTWAQQGGKLVGTGATGAAAQGYSVSLNADGNTAIVGAYNDNSNAGAAWVYTRSGGTWTQQGTKLVGTGATGVARQGQSVSISADGNTAIVSGFQDNSSTGAVWVYKRSGGTWAQQGTKLVGTGNVSTSQQGYSVSLSADGSTAMVGGNQDNSFTGAAWAFTVTQPPTITSFSPSSGPVGTLVSISGSNLDNTTLFSIGGAQAIVVSNTGSVLTGMVMPGASTGGISVSTSGGTATASGNFTVTPTPFPSAQQGAKLVGTGAVGAAQQGYSIAISADGNTAMVGGFQDNSGAGAAWAYTRSGGVWAQQGAKLVGTGAIGGANQGRSVAISADGNTAIVGGIADNSSIGAAWVYTRSGGVWAQQGAKLVGTGPVGTSQQGYFVAISADGNTIIMGGLSDNSNTGAAWIYTRSGGVWSQQGSKLVGTGAVGAALQGVSTSLSADGNTAMVGGYQDNSGIGAAWVYTRSGGVWSQQGTKLTGTGAVGAALQGFSTSLSADGNTAMVGGYQDNSGIGAAWAYTRSGGVWSQQGTKLIGTEAVGAAQQGRSVSLSADGSTALVGGYNDNSSAGAAWVYTRSGSVWAQRGAKLVGTGATGTAAQGVSVSLSADGSTALVGGVSDNSSVGAAWAYTVAQPAITSFSPTSAAAGTTLTLTGMDFINVTAVNFGGTAAASFTVVSPTSITAVVGAGASGSVNVVTISGTATLSGFSFLSSNANLSALSLSSGTLSPAFASGTASYTASVGNGISSITVTPTTISGTVTVNGTAVTSGSPSASIPLNVGANTLTILVTAQDGTTTQTYTVSVTRAQATQTITFAALPAKVYGDADFSAGATASSGLAASYTSSNTAVATVGASGNVHILSSGTTDITASQAGDTNNAAATSVVQTLTVDKATLTVTGDNQSKTYGTANPALTVTYTGFVNGDTNSSLTTQPTISTTANTTSATGSYPVTASSAASVNYTFAYTAGTLTVDKAILTVTADNKSKTYGSANPSLTVSYSGFVGSDNSSSLSTLPLTSTTATTTSAAGSYPITAIGAAAANYTFSYTVGTLTVSQAALTITANNQSKTYGSANPALTVTYAGFVNGDNSSSLTTQPTISTTATTASAVGSYPVTASGAAAANYTFTFVNGTLTIGQAALIITADNQSKTYGAANPALTVSYAGFVNGDTNTSLTTQPTISTTATTASAAGSYPITASGAASANYTFNYTAGTLTVGQAALIITADNQSKTYGSANPTLTVSYAGFVNVDNSSSLTAQPTISTTATIASAVGSYPITVSGAASANYTFSYTAGTLTVSQAGQAIMFAAPVAKTYGNADFALGATASSGLAVGYSSSNTAIATVDVNGNIHIVSAGTTTITASQAGDTNYAAATSVTQNLTVNKALLTVTANNQNKTYGLSNPVLMVSYSGFVGSDNSATLTTEPIVSTTATTASAVGNYPITPSGAAANNYTFTYVNGALTVVQASQTIIFAAPAAKTYGDADFALGTTATSGLAVSYISSNTSVATVSSSGSVHILSSGTTDITASQAGDANYAAATLVSQTLTVGKAALIITVDNQSKTYGAANPALTITYTGFVNGETSATLTTVPTLTTTATTASAADSYPVTASGAVAANYTFTYVNGTLTVGKAPLTITADNQSKAYGSANPALTVSYSGFVNSENSTALTTAPTLTTTATTASHVGSYPVTASGAAAANYNFSYTNGTLTVNKATLTVTGDNQSKTYGTANPALTVTYTGFVNGDTNSSLTTQPTISTTANTTSATGSYPVTASSAASVNYTFAYTAGTLTVDKAILTVTADNKSKAYGAANPVLTIAYNGFVESETVANLITAPTATTTATSASAIGTYPITASGGAAANYIFSYVNGVLAVGQTSQSITFAALLAKTYGDANSMLGATTSSDLAVSYNSSNTTVATVDASGNIHILSAGTTTITASQAGDANYSAATPVQQTLTINKAPLNISADSKTKTFGLANPELTLTYTGFVNGDNRTSLTTQPTVNTTATVSSAVGTYPITVTGAASANYQITYINGLLTIAPGIQIITFTVSPKTYGDADFTLNATASSGLPVTYSSSNTAIAVVDANGLVHIVKAGNVTISALQAGNNNYTATTLINQQLTINRAPLTVTADNQTKTYGAVNPVLTVSYTGFVNGDTDAGLTTLPVMRTTATAASATGTYPITISGAAGVNYAISYQPGTLTIEPSSQAITFASLPVKIYGDADFNLSASATSGLPVTYTSSNPLVATVDAAGKIHIASVGTTIITASQTGNTNYNAATDAIQTLTVAKASLTLAANNQTKTYGAANPDLMFNYTGFVNNETQAVLTTQPIISTTATAASAVGIYPVTVTNATAANYNIVYTDGNLTIVKAALTVTANNQSKVYGLGNPVLTVAYSGFFNGDTEANLNTVPTISTSATTTSAAGIYPLTPSGAAAANYTFTYVPGTLTITNATVNSVILVQSTVLENQSAGTIAGTLTATSLDPNATYTYSLVTGAGDTDNASFSIQNNKLVTAKTLDYEQKTIYSVLIRATNQYGLYLDKILTINLTDVNEAPTLAAISNQVVCYTLSAQNISLSGITPGPESTQNNSLSVSSTNPGLFKSLIVSTVSNRTATLTYQLAGSGTAVITVTNQDNGGTANGGTDSFRQTFTVSANDTPVAGIAADKATQISKGQTVTLTATGGSSYSWDNAFGITGSTNTATIQVRPNQTTTYQVKVSNASGCSTVSSITINVADDYALVHPANILTPNGDGKNDTWVVKNIDLYPNSTVLIFDRGGRRLKEFKNYNNDWDGTLNGSALAEGTYYYVIDFGSGIPLKGFITILRNR